MAGTPVAFQPNAFQNNAFQTGVQSPAWSDSCQSVPIVGRIQRSQPDIDQVRPPALRAGNEGESVLPGPRTRGCPQSHQVDVFPPDLNPRGGWHPHLPESRRIIGRQPDIDHVKPPIIVLVTSVSGWEEATIKQYRPPSPRAMNPDTLPGVNTGSWGWNPELPVPFRAPWPQARNIDVPPNVIAGRWGWNPELPGPFRAPWPQARNIEIPPNVISGSWGWNPELPRPFRTPCPRSTPVDVVPNIIAGSWGWHPEMPGLFRAPYPGAINIDILSNGPTGGHGWESILPILGRSRRIPDPVPESPSSPYPIGSGWEAISPGGNRPPIVSPWEDCMIPCSSARSSTGSRGSTDPTHKNSATR